MSIFLPGFQAKTEEKEAPSNDSVEKIADESSYCPGDTLQVLTSTMNENQFEFQDCGLI